MIVNLGDDEMSFTNQSAELRNACRNLRAGDEVMLDFRTLSNGDKPFIAILSKVDSRATDFTCINGEKFTRMMPLIHWPSRGNSDALHHVEGSERSHSDASFVVGIISKAPYKTEKNPIRNALYHQRMHKLAAYEKENKPYVDYTSFLDSETNVRDFISLHSYAPPYIRLINELSDASDSFISLIPSEPVLDYVCPLEFKDPEKYGSVLSDYYFKFTIGDLDRKSTRLNSSHSAKSRMPSSA